MNVSAGSANRMVNPQTGVKDPKPAALVGAAWILLYCFPVFRHANVLVQLNPIARFI